MTGKYLIDELITDRSKQLGGAFTLRRFFDEVNAAGLIPVSLIRREITGLDSRGRRRPDGALRKSLPE